MSRTVNLVLASVTAFFLLFPLTLGKPGLPPHLKADEAAYYLAALSLAHDGDLRVEPKDVDRAFQEFPFGPVNNMIVMTDDGWHTVYFGKPYIYSFFAAPFAWAFGANGLLFFNMLLTMAMVWMGYLYLRRYNPPGIAALFSASFFLLSVGFSYVFWIQPEVFSMAAVAACLFFGLPRRDESGFADRRRELLWAALSGTVLVLAAYNKPMFAAVGVAPLWAYFSERRWKAIGAWMAGAALSLGIVAGIATALTGHPSAYLGVRRQGVTLCEPGKMPIEPEVTKATGGVAAAHSPTGNAWTWLLRKPDVTMYEMAENIEYFLVGRHTGLLVYTPFAGLAVLLFLLRRRSRTRERWVLLAALTGVGLFFLVSIAWNWQGGGGFVGNRYYISVIPAFLFLVTEIRPRWLVAVGHAAAGLFLAPLLFTPFGASVPEPTLQAHVRNSPIRYLPFELSLRNVPGYERIPVGDLRIVGRKDVFRPLGDQMWIGGADRVELYLLGAAPVEKAMFQVTNLAPGNRIEIEMGDAHEVMDFEGEETRRVLLTPGEPFRVRRQKTATFYVYKMVVTSRTGRVQSWVREFPPNSCRYFTQTDKLNESFFVGASLAYLGTGDQLEKDVFAIQWGNTVAPSQAVAGKAFKVLTRLFNRSGETWTADGAARVNLSYHWLDEKGTVLERDGFRTPIPLPVGPGDRVSVEQVIVAPKAPGRYVLELDPVFETVAWFSEKNGGETLRLPVEVLPAGAELPGEAAGAR